MSQGSITTADLSPYLWYPRPIISSIAGAVGDRALQYWPIRDLLESGANVAAGSDWPSVAESMNPRPAIEAMVTRRNPHTNDPQTYWAEQAISLAQALKIFTLDGARAYRLEDLTGSVEVGKSADLVVLDRDYLETPPDEVRDIQPVMTMVGGEVVYRAE